MCIGISLSGVAGDTEVSPAVGSVINWQHLPPRPVWQPKQAEQMLKRLGIK